MKFYIELTDTEREILGAKAAKAGLSAKEYAKKCLMNGAVYYLDIEEILPVLDRCSDTIIAMRKLGRKIDSFVETESTLSNEENQKLLKMGNDIQKESEKLRKAVAKTVFSKRRVGD